MKCSFNNQMCADASRSLSGLPDRCMRVVVAVLLCVVFLPASALAVDSGAGSSGAVDLTAGRMKVSDQTTDVVEAYDVSAAADETLLAELHLDGVLALRGEGAMRDFESADDVPWAARASDITSVELPDGLETVGSFAFAGLSNASYTSVKVPASVTAIGACAFADCPNLVAVDMTEATLIARVGDGAFCSQASGMTVYVASAEAATHVTAATIEDGAYVGGTTLADTTALAIANGGAFADGTAFSSGVLARPLVKDGYTFVAWTTDASLMHPDPGWHAMATGCYYAKFETSAGWLDDPVDYPGYQGLDQQVRLLDPDELPAVEVAGGILFYGENDQAFVNGFAEPFDGDADIKFAFSIARGSAANGGDGTYQKTFTLPYVSIVDSNGTTVASWEGGNGTLKLFDLLFDATPGKQQGNTITAFTMGVYGGTLDAGAYKLVFDKGLGANNGISFLGKNVEFSFEVTRSGATPGDEVDLPDGIYVNGIAIQNGGTVALSPKEPTATVQVVRGRTDVTRLYSGYITNTNVVFHGGTAPSLWAEMAAQANGACEVILRTSAGIEYARMGLQVSGFEQDGSTEPSQLATGTFQGNGATICLMRVGDEAATVSTVDFDETLEYFDDYVAEPVAVTGGTFTLALGGPGMYWDESRWDWDDWTANHLNPYLRLLDEHGVTVATVGGGLHWVDLGTSNSITLGVDEGVMQDGATYTLVADAMLTGHNVAASLQKAVHWTFTAQEVEEGGGEGSGGEGSGGDSGQVSPIGSAQWKRLWGNDAYGTMQRVVREGFTSS
ncbi:MAG: leucine-rich repeat protein, partial [Eggerthellaceae bacterium]|nr:leucine-rich repeat protein [Eggerthellaceae bacterium]